MSELSKAIREAFPALEMRENELLSSHVSFRIGGPAKRILLPESSEELEALCALLRRLGEKPLILGNGTNVLPPDEGIDGTVIFTKKAAQVSVDGETVRADCGAGVTRVSGLAAEAGLTGLEFAYGIPGTIGGALTMNAGAYGGEIKDVTVQTEYLDGELRKICVEGAEHDFAYRHSRFTASDVILRTELRLRMGDREAVKTRCRELTEKRKASQPLEKPSAGSAFKRPKQGYAAALIDGCGLKGFRIGGAQVSEKHAGFVVNLGGATASDVKRLLEEVQKRVLAETGILLEPEIRML